MKKISNRKMCHEALAKIIFGHFCRHGIRTWKSWPSFFKFQFMFILAILCNRRQETISIWLNIAFNYSFLRTPVGWIKCECHYWLVCVQTLPPPPHPSHSLQQKSKKGRNCAELTTPEEKLKTMLVQNFGVTNKERYGMLWYFLGWSIFVHHGAQGGKQDILCRLLNTFGNSHLFPGHDRD